MDWGGIVDPACPAIMQGINRGKSMPANRLFTARSLLLASLPASLFAIAPANAQTAPDIVVAQVPLSDTNCDFNQVAPPTTASQCTISGTRSMTLTNTTRTAFNATLDSITSTYAVQFDGNLQIDGLPIATGAPAIFPGARDASFYFDPASVSVDLATSYDGLFRSVIPNALPTPNQAVDRPYFQNFANFNNTIRSIDVAQSGSISTLDGGEYDFSVASADPTAIVGNGVALSGSFSGTSGSGAIQFGRIGGTANLVNGPARSSYPAGLGQNVALLSAFALQYNPEVQLTTQLDENGLIAPTVTVTDGIEMNGSKITGLADGTAPTDAVNKGQLDAEASARQTADAALAADLASEATTRANADTALQGSIASEATLRANADLQINQRIATEEANRAALGASLLNESNARIAGDLALSNQLGALGSRVTTLEGRVDQLDEKVSSSTAIAVAMGGATFLPDMKFNLTANVGTYDGAHAGSLQIGALVSDHVAINAGVATGFNKNGKTAGRVGVTFGW
jgi:hypothetical protein